MIGPISKLIWALTVVLFIQGNQANAGLFSKNENVANNKNEPCYTLEQKSPIPFKAFSNINPQTGKAYNKKDTITIPKPSGEVRVNALSYLEEVNNLERDLSGLGYSLRNNSLPENALTKCRSIKYTSVTIDESEFSNYTFVDESEWAARVENSHLRLIAGEGDSPKKEVEFPELPPLGAEPTVKIDRAKMEAKYERAWLFEYGNPGEFYTSVNPYVTVHANSLEAVGQAGVKWNGAIMGQWQGEFAHVWARAQTPGSGAMRADIEMTVIDGKRVWAKPLIDTKPFSLGDRYAQSLSKGVTYRFMVGPIPFKAEVGVRGEAGFKWEVKVFPLQAAAYATPWVGADAYARIGGDVVAAGGGVGGRLIFLKDSLVVSGSASFEKAKNFQAHLVANVSDDLEALKGELYAFAYVYYPNLESFGTLARWGTQIPIYSYEGYTFKYNLFNFDETYEFFKPKS